MSDATCILCSQTAALANCLHGLTELPSLYETVALAT
jgi:hypothetical protein